MTLVNSLRWCPAALFLAALALAHHLLRSQVVTLMTAVHHQNAVLEDLQVRTALPFSQHAGPHKSAISAPAAVRYDGM